MKMSEHQPQQGPALSRTPLPSDDPRRHEPGQVVGNCVGCGAELRGPGWLVEGNVHQGSLPEPRYTQWQRRDEHGCGFGAWMFVCSTCEVVVRPRFVDA